MTAPEISSGIPNRVSRALLDNGLRVVIAPEPGTGVVAVAVHYGAGYRSEPAGRAGFAHLFEHLMFQGSEHVAKLGHLRHIQAAGGSGNAVTTRDHTCFHQIAPSAALEQIMFLEADRMRAPRFTAASLATQIAVIREEIGANIKGRPYGGLPWLLLPPVLFDSYTNTHDGYGAVAELAAATVADVEDFFDLYYGPGNAVLTVAGDVEVAETLEFARRHFGPIAARPTPPPPDLAEPAPAAGRDAEHNDPLAPLPAVVVGWRVPGAPGVARLSYAVLATILAGRDNARLSRRLLREGGATHVGATPFLAGGLLESRDPDAFVITTMCQPGPSGATAQSILTTLDAELAELASTGPRPRELAAAATTTAVDRYRRLGDLRRRAQLLGAFELIHGHAELAWDLAEQARRVSPEAVATAAADLAGAPRAVLRILAGGGRFAGHDPATLAARTRLTGIPEGASR